MSKQQGINVLSLFDGISCGQYVLREKLNVKINKYYASEIEKAPIKNTMHNYPETIQLGDVTKIDFDKLPKIDLLIGGSPCQGFSFSGKQLAFDDPRSVLFFEYVKALRILRSKNPKLLFFLENVNMAKKHQDVITKYLNVSPVYIDSTLFSVQSRKRLYWTNIPLLPLPEKECTLYAQEVLDEPVYLGNSTIKYNTTSKAKKLYEEALRILPVMDKKLPCIRKSGEYNVPINYYKTRTLTQTELERIAGLREGFTKTINRNQAKQAVGNGWECNTITFLFYHLTKR